MGLLNRVIPDADIVKIRYCNPMMVFSSAFKESIIVVDKAPRILWRF